MKYKPTMIEAVAVFALLHIAACTMSPIDRVNTRLNCQDYANAWCREAQAQGIKSGVIHYRTECGTSHAICWAVDDDKMVFIEPRPYPHKIDFSLSGGHVFRFSDRPTVSEEGNDKRGND